METKQKQAIAAGLGLGAVALAVWALTKQAKAGERGNVYGYVFDDSTWIPGTGYTPIAGALVRLGNMSRVTSATGSFTFGSVATGRYNIHIEAAGYLSFDGIFDVIEGDNPWDILLTPA